MLFAEIDLKPVEPFVDELARAMAPLKRWFNFNLAAFMAKQQIRPLPDEQMRLALLLSLQRVLPLDSQLREQKTQFPGHMPWGSIPGGEELWQERQVLVVVIEGLLQMPLPLQSVELAALCRWVCSDDVQFDHTLLPIAALVKALEHFVVKHSDLNELAEVVESLKAKLEPKKAHKAYRQLYLDVGLLLENRPPVPLRSGEAWSDRAIVDLSSLDEAGLSNWVALLEHCQEAAGSKPSAKWLKRGDELLEVIGSDVFKRITFTWLTLTDLPRTEPILDWNGFGGDPNDKLIEQHQDILRGIVWLLCQSSDAETAQVLTKLAFSCYRKIPGFGARVAKLGNACIYGLGTMSGSHGVQRLAVLKSRISLRSVLKQIDAALDKAALREGVSRDELEELSAPACGLTEIGVQKLRVGDFTALLTIDPCETVKLVWQKSDGSVQKAVPAAAKQIDPEAVKQLNADLKEVRNQLTLQKGRIEGFYRGQKRWDYRVWQERYLDHPLIGHLVRRLIWRLTQPQRVVDVLWLDGGWQDAEGRRVDTTGASIQLWHPLDSSDSDRALWRSLVDRYQIVQPFKQAERECFAPNDDESGGSDCTVRFSGHLLNQHVLSALAQQKGWQYGLQGAWDTPKQSLWLQLTPFSTVIRWQVEGVGEFGRDTTDAGIYLQVKTGLLSFCRLDEAQKAPVDDGKTTPVAIADIPPVLLSEIYRDIALFVAAGSK